MVKSLTRTRTPRLAYNCEVKADSRRRKKKIKQTFTKDAASGMLVTDRPTCQRSRAPVRMNDVHHEGSRGLAWRPMPPDMISCDRCIRLTCGAISPGPSIFAAAFELTASMVVSWFCHMEFTVHISSLGLLLLLEVQQHAKSWNFKFGF